MKFKRIAMAIVFFISQVSLAHGEGSKKKNDEFDNLPLSAMILNGERIAALNDDDRTAYIRAILFLSRVLERSQAQKFEYESPAKYEPSKTGMKESALEKHSSMFSMYWNLVVGKANALVTWLAGWTMKAAKWGGSRLATGSLKAAELAKAPKNFVADVATTRYAKDLARANASGIPAEVTKVERNIRKAGLKLDDVKQVAAGLRDKDMIKSSLVSKLKDVKLLENQREAARAAGNFDEVKKLDTQITRSEIEISRTKRAFLEANGGNTKELTTLLRRSNTTTAHKVLSKVAETVLVAGAGYEGGKYLGYWGNPQIKLEDRKLRDGLAASEADKNPGKIVREHGYSCIYGGRASTLVRNSEGNIFCKLPDGSQTEKCNVNTGHFLCPSYGFSLPFGDIDKELCIKIEPKKDLTSNCMDKFEEQINTAGELVLKEGGEAKLLEFNENLRKLLVLLEGDAMTDIENKSHSFNYYCANSKKAQKSECNALTAFVNRLKDRKEVKEAIVAQAEATAPSTDAAAAAAAATANGGPPPMPPVETTR